tara:strand:- start:407 stop:613 length:207 start_codon:yes stop_codon:yes gene_type:complete
VGQKQKKIIFHFTHKRRVEYLSDRELLEEKNDAEFYLGICKKVRQSLTPHEKYRVRGINRELRKRNFK